MKKLWSIFTDDMDRCIITGRTDHIERHHIFGGANRKRSEKYGFIAPLTAEMHPNGVIGQSRDLQAVDGKLKRLCQEYYFEHIGNREDWYREFGRFYDADDTEEEDEVESEVLPDWFI